MSENRRSEHAWSDHVAAYALEALEPGERQAFEAHLADCDWCRSEVEEMRQVTGALAHVAPPVAPPPALRERVLAEARQVRPITAAPARPARDGRARAPWIATAASVALAVAAGWGYWQERREAETLAQGYAEARAALAERDSLLSTLLAPEIRTIRLAADSRDPSVRLFWNPERRLVVLTAAELRPAPSGRTYQLWGIAAGGAPVSLGTFNTSRAGDARLAVAVPPELDLAISAITEEPEGGSPQPTTTPFLVGEWGE